MSFMHRKEFDELHSMMKREQGAPYKAILKELDAIKEKLARVATMSDRDPEFGMMLHALESNSNEVMKTVRQSGVRGIKIPQSLHTLRTSLRQPDLVRKIAIQIAA